MAEFVKTWRANARKLAWLQLVGVGLVLASFGVIDWRDVYDAARYGGGALLLDWLMQD